MMGGAQVMRPPQELSGRIDLVVDSPSVIPTIPLMITVPYPSTARFSISRDPNRCGIDGKPSRILEIMYQSTPESEPREFGHTWDIRGWEPENEGKWTFNRSIVAAENEWWPAIYTHNTLADLLNHLEETFTEGMPTNHHGQSLLNGQSWD